MEMRESAGNAGKAFEELVEIMDRLRSPEGCPWDREQTHESLKESLIEESYEAIDAIEAKDMDELRGELGDILLQIVFHARLAEETNAFNINDVIDGINAKLLRRHPHVFGEESASCAEEVLHRWEQIKSTEKGNEKRESVLDGVPSHLPALMRAMEVSKKAARAGFEWPNVDAVVDKLDEEVHELKAELHSGNKERISDEIGDLLFTIVNIARWEKIDTEDALRLMIRRFSTRFRKIEEAAKASGRRIDEMSLEEMEEVWEKAKGADDER